MSLHDRITRLTADRDAARAERDELARTLLDLTAEADKLSANLTVRRALDHVTLASEPDEPAAEVARLADELAEATMVADQRADELAQVTAERDRLASTLYNRDGQHRDQLNGHIIEARRQSERIAELHRANADLSQRVDRLTAGRYSALATIADLRDERNRLAGALADLIDLIEVDRLTATAIGDARRALADGIYRGARLAYDDTEHDDPSGRTDGDPPAYLEDLG